MHAAPFFEPDPSGGALGPSLAGTRPKVDQNKILILVSYHDRDQEEDDTSQQEPRAVRREAPEEAAAAAQPVAAEAGASAAGAAGPGPSSAAHRSPALDVARSRPQYEGPWQGPNPLIFVSQNRCWGPNDSLGVDRTQKPYAYTGRALGRDTTL